jgi:hypothetical protein
VADDKISSAGTSDKKNILFFFAAKAKKRSKN